MSVIFLVFTFYFQNYFLYGRRLWIKRCLPYHNPFSTDNYSIIACRMTRILGHNSSFCTRNVCFLKISVYKKCLCEDQKLLKWFLLSLLAVMLGLILSAYYNLHYNYYLKKKTRIFLYINQCFFPSGNNFNVYYNRLIK